MAKPPYLEMGVVVSFSEIFNRPATLEGAREVLAQYKREAVLLVLAKLSAALRLVPTGLPEGQWAGARCVQERATRRCPLDGGEPTSPVLHAAWCAGDGTAGPKRVQQARGFRYHGAATGGARLGVLLNDERTHLQHRATDGRGQSASTNLQIRRRRGNSHAAHRDRTDC